MKSKEQIKLEEYQAAALTLGTSVSYLKELDSDGPRCESSYPVYKCIKSRCCWFIKCYPEFKDTGAKFWCEES